MHRSLLIDSNILIDHLRKEKNALDFLDRALEKGYLLFLSVVSRAGIYAGMRKGEGEAICSLFQIIKPVNVDATIADKAGEYLRKFSKSHPLEGFCQAIKILSGKKSQIFCMIKRNTSLA